ncbi:PREDICTED: SHC-transforming protein 4 [Nanorana parkeri]|uniref:SHC-transforming protein 4 n=1 Tax=Nanorana parkeri TaxID=125878 RepID=UPI000854770E|nr:PREDICTED: SHC-transforming protein 4 [Nanorana parkeri]
MRDHRKLSGQILHESFLRYPVMLQRAKYSRFRNTPTEECVQNPNLNAKGCANSCAAADSFLPVESLTLVTQDRSTTLCTLIPKMSHFKLPGSGSLMRLRHFSLGTKEVPRLKLNDSHRDQRSPTATEITFNSYVRPSQVKQDVDTNANPQEDCLLPDAEKSAPEQNISHTKHVNMGPVLCYCVKYMGCIEVLQSMRSLDFGTRTQVTREAISRLCEAVPCAKGAARKRKPPLKFLSSVLGKSNLQFSGINVKLTISTNSLTLTDIDTQQIVANHHMQSISFASGGDPDTTDYVAYVAKDPVNQRACHILECPNSKAQEVINTIGQAFELRFKQFLKSPSFKDESDLSSLSNVAVKEEEGHEYYNELPGKEPPAGGVLDKRMKVETTGFSLDSDEQNSKVSYMKSVNVYENCLENEKTVGLSDQDVTTGREELFDDPSYINTVPKTQSPDKTQVSRKAYINSVTLDPGYLCESGKLPVSSSIQREEWFHGRMNRNVTESLLLHDGDFLVRESTTSIGQYVLSGLHEGHPKHLLLVDPEGKVRTKDHIFENVSHLIKHHVENELPIISSGSELCLRQPVKRQERLQSQLE